jgi:hypothetical protein
LARMTFQQGVEGRGLRGPAESPHREGPPSKLLMEGEESKAG